MRQRRVLAHGVRMVSRTKKSEITSKEENEVYKCGGSEREK